MLGCAAPLYLPLLPLPCTLIRAEEPPLFLLVREMEEGGHETDTFQKAWLTYFMAHYGCLASAPPTTHQDLYEGGKEKKKGEERGKEQESILNTCPYISLSLRSFIQSFITSLNGLPLGGFKCSFFSLNFKILYSSELFHWGACGEPCISSQHTFHQELLQCTQRFMQLHQDRHQCRWLQQPDGASSASGARGAQSLTVFPPINVVNGVHPGA